MLRENLSMLSMEDTMNNFLVDLTSAFYFCKTKNNLLDSSSAFEETKKKILAPLSEFEETERE